MNHRTVFLLAAATLCATAPATAGGKKDRPFGDTQVLAPVPADPGYPEGILVHGNKAFVAGPAAFATAGHGPSKVLEYNTRNGQLLHTYAIEGENCAEEHVISGLAMDADERLYVLSTQLGVIRLDHDHHHAQEPYAGLLPDLPSCAAAAPGAACSPTMIDRPPFPNDITFDDDGNLYITDSWQATIFRVPAGGGAPVPWFQDARIDAGFGANGIRVTPDRSRVVFAVTGNIPGTGPAAGAIYSVPLVDDPQPAEMTLVHDFGFGGPDGFAFGADGSMFVALAFTSQLAVLNRHGNAMGVLPSAQQSTLLTIPYDSPSSIAFNGRGALLMTNHALLDPDPASKFAVFDVQVNDQGDELPAPCVP